MTKLDYFCWKCKDYKIKTHSLGSGGWQMKLYIFSLFLQSMAYFFILYGKIGFWCYYFHVPVSPNTQNFVLCTTFVIFKLLSFSITNIAGI
jgi:hypothetical protein